DVQPPGSGCHVRVRRHGADGHVAPDIGDIHQHEPEQEELGAGARLENPAAEDSLAGRIEACVPDADPGQRDNGGGEIVMRREDRTVIDFLIDLLLKQDIGQVRMPIIDRQGVGLESEKPCTNEWLYSCAKKATAWATSTSADSVNT
ncbi:MAG TPA: hypothetical protein VFW75_13550, partial [Acetobacteraceae bacterium]|nr:hypothetical protein [Acetobacteraceae bacterium]